jgi:transposase InsO family protein
MPYRSDRFIAAEHFVPFSDLRRSAWTDRVRTRRTARVARVLRAPVHGKGINIPHWRGTVVALSNERHNIPLLRAAAARYPDPAELGTPRYEHVGDQVFELRMVPLAGKAETSRSYVVVIADLTEALREIDKTTRQNITIGLCGLVVVWAMDICYIPMRQGFVYLAAVMDWCSRRILAWRLSNSSSTPLQR